MNFLIFYYISYEKPFDPNDLLFLSYIFIAYLLYLQIFKLCTLRKIDLFIIRIFVIFVLMYLQNFSPNFIII
ncbi:hypothetical protein C1646_727859 [Rhizophagus diaphanus]|nr:hypothetical protein C1646_727859 [Rhizophagus diaphanus] [Rhizophagus sp. MUCL 43196]